MTVAEYTNGHVGSRAAFSPQDHSRDLEFWRTQLAGDLPACGLPYDYPYPSVGTRSYAAEQFTMPNRLTEDLTSLAVPGDNPQFLSCLTGFIALLSRYTGQDKIVVGTLGGARSVPDENAAETAAHPLALRVDVSGNPTFRELQSRVNSVLREALEHQGVAFPRVLAELVQRPGQHTLFKVAVSHHLGTSRNAFRRDDFSEGGQMLDLDITIEEHDGQISGTMQ